MTTIPCREDLLRQLVKVVEPCSVSMGSPMSICDMGLIEDVSFDAGTVRVVLCLTDPSCINYGKIKQYVIDVLLELEPVKAVEVTHTTSVLWTPDRVKTPPRIHPINPA